MTIQALETAGHVYIDDLKDVTFTDVSRTSGVAIQVNRLYGSNILNHRYYADPSGQVHLDLRNLVLSRVYMQPPSSDQVVDQASAGFHLDVMQGETSYIFYAFGFRDGLRQRLSRIDYLRVPQDFRLVVCLPNMANHLNADTVDGIVTYVDHIRTRTVDNLDHIASAGYILTKEFSMADVHPSLHMPFHLEFSFPDIPIATQPKLSTPVYEVCSGPFEQYLFLNEFGSFENIPMDGDLVSIPNYAFENARHPSGMVKVKDGMEELWEQSSGHLTAAAAGELSRLLCSSDIFHLEDGVWKRILVESPSVSLSKQNTLRSVTFSWRHAATK